MDQIRAQRVQDEDRETRKAEYMRNTPAERQVFIRSTGEGANRRWYAYLPGNRPWRTNAGEAIGRYTAADLWDYLVYNGYTPFYDMPEG